MSDIAPYKAYFAYNNHTNVKIFCVRTVEQRVDQPTYAPVRPNVITNKVPKLEGAQVQPFVLVGRTGKHLLYVPWVDDKTVGRYNRVYQCQQPNDKPFDRERAYNDLYEQMQKDMPATPRAWSWEINEERVTGHEQHPWHTYWYHVSPHHVPTRQPQDNTITQVQP